MEKSANEIFVLIGIKTIREGNDVFLEHNGIKVRRPYVPVNLHDFVLRKFNIDSALLKEYSEYD